MPLTADTPTPVAHAWAAYDQAEQELWDEYAASNREHLDGRVYVLGENRLRRVLERRVREARAAWLSARAIHEEMCPQ